MDRAKKNRNGSVSNDHPGTENMGNRKRNEQPGAPASSNRQTGGSRREERDNSNDRNTNRQDTKKGPNSI